MDKPKILIIRRSALGDTIHTLPLAKSLREKFPNAQIDWIVEDKAEKFITNNPLLNKVYVIHKKTGGFAEFKQIIKQTFTASNRLVYIAVQPTANVCRRPSRQARALPSAEQKFSNVRAVFSP